MLGDSPLKDTLVRVMEEEAWQKALFNHHNAKFEVMYASTVPEGVATGRSQAIASLVAQVQDLGGNGGELLAPRRTYTRARQEVIDALPAGVTVRCPTEEQRRQCEEGGTIFGIPLEQSQITHACDGRPGECVMQDGLCADGIASEGLPASLRTYADFLWQRSPFDIGEQASVEGQLQSPGSDLSEPYWLARHYGFISAGEGQALAWRDLGACP
jgi:hypothetical protein